jgi:hypothetical protein
MSSGHRHLTKNRNSAGKHDNPTDTPVGPDETCAVLRWPLTDKSALVAREAHFKIDETRLRQLVLDAALQSLNNQQQREAIRDSKELAALIEQQRPAHGSYEAIVLALMTDIARRDRETLAKRALQPVSANHRPRQMTATALGLVAMALFICTLIASRIPNRALMIATILIGLGCSILLMSRIIRGANRRSNYLHKLFDGASLIGVIAAIERAGGRLKDRFR